jgi:LPXTG-motif cell wall-anchored protein
MIDTINHTLEAWAQHVPLEIFTFFGSFIEEVIAPIPSPFVPMLAGSIAKAQEHFFWYLTILSLIGAAGKVGGAWLVYVISDKAEDVVIGKFGRFLGVSHKEVESLGKKFNGGWRDGILLFFLRTAPIIPSTVVSVCSGVIKIDMRVYIIATFMGTIVRDFFYLYVGFTGVETLRHLVEGFDSIESVLQALAGLAIVILVGWIYWKRKRK